MELAKDGYEASAKLELDVAVYGRICAVADVFDELTNRRPYNRAFSDDESPAITGKGRRRLKPPVRRRPPDRRLRWREPA